jgi:hypothetical protein
MFGIENDIKIKDKNSDGKSKGKSFNREVG